MATAMMARNATLWIMGPSLSGLAFPKGAWGWALADQRMGDGSGSSAGTRHQQDDTANSEEGLRPNVHRLSPLFRSNAHGRVVFVVLRRRSSLAPPIFDELASELPKSPHNQEPNPSSSDYEQDLTCTDEGARPPVQERGGREARTNAEAIDLVHRGTPRREWGRPAVLRLRPWCQSGLLDVAFVGRVNATEHSDGPSYVPTGSTSAESATCGCTADGQSRRSPARLRALICSRMVVAKNLTYLP
jgi:hypothetical protein